MLKFEEAERPSFVELAKLVLTSTENTLESPKGGTKVVNGKKVVETGNKTLAGNPSGSKSMDINKKVQKTFSANNLKENDGLVAGQSSNVPGSMEKVGRKIIDSSKSDMNSHL